MDIAGSSTLLRWSKPQLASVADQLRTPVSVISRDGILLYANRAAARAYGLGIGSLVGRPLLEFIHLEDRPRFQQELLEVVQGRITSGLITYRVKNEISHQWRVFESTADNLLGHPDIEGILVSSRDMTDQLVYQDRLYAAAYHDSLTGLPNRANIESTLGEWMKGRESVSVAFVGIDRFAQITDSLGHGVGDTVFKVFAARICSSVPLSVLVGRQTNGVFVLLFKGTDSVDASEILTRCIEHTSGPISVSGHEFLVNASGGFAFRRSDSTVESLTRDAGLALTHARGAGGGRVVLASERMLESAISRMDLEAEIRHAIERSEFSLALQPIVRLPDRVPVRSEALVRWTVDGVTHLPGEFIQVAEETGLIIPLGDWIIDRAIELAAASGSGPIMVNLSACQLVDPGLPERIGRLLAARGVPPSAVGFEVTESLLIKDFDFAVSALGKIRQLGCKIGLDDFGTGYSSLSYLATVADRLPEDRPDPGY